MGIVLQDGIEAIRQMQSGTIDGNSTREADPRGRRCRGWIGALGAVLASTLASLACETAHPPPGQSQAAPITRPHRAVLISIEGLTADHYQWLPSGGLQEEKRSHAPHLIRLASRGVFADELVPVNPATLYPTHASLASGRHPNHHGVVADLLIGEQGIQLTPYWRADRLEGDSLWRAAKRAKLTVASLAWPTTIGAEIEWLVPDRPPVRYGETWIDVLQTETTPWLWRRIIELAPDPPPNAWPSIVERDALLTQLACDMAADPAPPALLLLRWGQIAWAQTASGPGSREALNALRRVDHELGRLLECYRKNGLTERTTFFVSGDRNLEPVLILVRPNVTLADAGLLTPRSLRTQGQTTKWSAIVRSNGRSAFVYARDEASAVLARTALRAEAERRGRFRVVSATELQKLEIDPQVWFGLAAAPGVWFQNDSVGKVEAVSALLGAAGGLPGSGARPIGFVAAGPGLRKGVRIPRMEQVDVAPTLAHLLQFELEEADGQPMIGLLEATLPASIPDASRRSGRSGSP